MKRHHLLPDFFFLPLKNMNQILVRKKTLCFVFEGLNLRPTGMMSN